MRQVPPPTSQSTEPDPRAALRAAIEYLRDEANRLELAHVARALDRALTLLSQSH